MKSEKVRIVVACALLAHIAFMPVAFAGVSAAPEWENPEVNSINRLPARSYSMPLADEQAAFSDELEPPTPYKMSLNGTWRLSWAGNPDLRVKDFWKTDFDDGDWFDIEVPSCVELMGFGSPGYTNVRYPHANLSNPTNPAFATIRDRQSGKRDYNPVSSYRRMFTVPQEWKGRRIILRFDGVYSAYYVWVNGEKVGYAEDSKLPSEFDITPYCRWGKKGEGDEGGTNILAVEVYRWCDGSYLEDQDMTRYSGIFRDVTIWSMPENGIWDFAVKTELLDDCTKGVLSVEGIEGEWSATLYGADRKPVIDFASALPGRAAYIPAPHLWSAENPYLYTLVIRKGDDVRMKRVGFKEQKIVGNAITVNGKKVKFKGVNRHETNPETGRTVSLQDMIRDVTLMKRYNINTVRTSHYPDHHLWYDLCDRYGIYLVAEANVEGHEPGYKADGIGLFKEWRHTIVERNERHATFYRNHPSVTLWSMGNETGHGDCFRDAIAAVKRIDPSRPVHWERGNVDADVDSRMYPSVEWLDARGRAGDLGIDTSAADNKDKSVSHTPGKAFFMCEYAHAMGNAIGNFAEYWDVFYKYDSLSGGCIWDWVDQAVWKYTGKVDPATGKRERFLSYGGDFDEEPNDGPFNCNGVVDPLRRVTAKLIEVGHVHRNLVVTRAAELTEKGDVIFELWNRFAFTRADEFIGAWELVVNGRSVKSGLFDVPKLEPLSRCQFTVPDVVDALEHSGAAKDAEVFANFSFRLKKDTLWANRGWAVARDQVRLCGEWKGSKPVVACEVEPVESERTVEVSVGGTKAVFSRTSGTLSELTMNGRTILRNPVEGIEAGPMLTCARAMTDNDIWMRVSFYDSGLSQLRYHARPIVISGNEVRTTVEVTGSKSAGFTHETCWRFAADGAIEMANRVTPHGTMPAALPRLGLSLKLAGDLKNVEWFGRGPRENYIDRSTGSFIGTWKSSVEGLAEFYVRPQDNGYRGDVRTVEFRDGEGKGVEFSASEPMFVQALGCGWEDLEFSRHRNRQQRFRTPIVADGWINLNLDVRQLGLGGASCGPRPLDKYIFAICPMEWRLKISPLR